MKLAMAHPGSAKAWLCDAFAWLINLILPGSIVAEVYCGLCGDEVEERNLANPSEPLSSGGRAMNPNVRRARASISPFGVLAVIWAATVAAILSHALNRNLIGTTRLICFAVFLLTVIVSIERVRVALARHRRDRDALKATARRFSA